MTASKNRYVILTVGYIHSGKTSFAKKLVEEIPDLVCLERDPIAAMLHNYFPAIKAFDMAKRQANDKPVKDKIYELLLQEAINHEAPIIVSTCNSTYETRHKIKQTYREKIPNVQFIFVYFDIAMSILEERVKHSVRPIDVLTFSNDFAVALNNQKRFFEIPTPDEADLFLTIKNNDNTAAIIADIKSLIAKN